MKWISFEKDGKESFGLVVGEAVIDAGARTRFGTLKEAIASDESLDSIGRSLGQSGDFLLEDVVFLPTITRPDKILCVGLNYKEHQEETGRGGEDNPTIFVRFASAQIGHEAKMIRPTESTNLDFEGEIAVIIGKGGRRIKKSDWLEHVAGFSCYNDGSVRDYQRHTSQFTPGKNFTGTGGFGPWMVTPDEIDDFDEMEITTRLNGEVMQNAKAKLLVFGFGDLVQYISSFTELVAGDVIVTGTPGGVGFARNPPVWMDEGDIIEIQVDPIGTLTNHVTVG